MRTVSSSARRRLFGDVDYEPDLDHDEHARYRAANDNAERYASWLERAFVVPRRIPEMLDELRALAAAPPRLTTAEFPIVLSVGERRAYTANDIFRDPSWRKRDADGALRVSVEDAQALGLVHGCRARISTAAGSAEASVEITETMLAGHAALPNGFGLDYTDDDGHTVAPGVAPNALTSTGWRDPYAGTPWHKHVPARIELCLAQKPELTSRS